MRIHVFRNLIINNVSNLSLINNNPWMIAPSYIYIFIERPPDIINIANISISICIHYMCIGRFTNRDCSLITPCIRGNLNWTLEDTVKTFHVKNICIVPVYYVDATFIIYNQIRINAALNNFYKVSKRTGRIIYIVYGTFIKYDMYYTCIINSNGRSVCIFPPTISN